MKPYAFVVVCLGLSNAVAQPPAKPAATPPVVAATVDGEEIKLDEVDVIFRQRPKGAPPLTAAQVREMRLAAVEVMIEDRLLKQFLAKHGPKVEPAEIEEQLKALEQSLSKQGKKLADFFKETGLTEEVGRDQFLTQIRFMKYVDATVTDAQLKQFHEQNKDYFDKIQVRTGVIVLRLTPGALPGEKATARQKLTGLKAEILARKTTFAAAAKRFSVDPSAKNDGELGMIPRFLGPVDDAIAAAAFALKPGEISEPVEMDGAMALVTCLERSAPTPAKFEQISEWVKDTFAQRLRDTIVQQRRKDAVVRVLIS